MSPLDVSAVLVFALVASTAQSLTGFGFGLLIVPPLVIVLGPHDAVILSNVLGTALAGMMVLRTHEHVEWRAGATLILCAVAGMPVGLGVLLVTDAALLQVVIAVCVIVFTVLLASGVTLGDRPSLRGDVVAGFTSGLLRTSTSMSGPPVVLYFQGTGMPSQVFRGTISAFFFVSGVLALVLFLIEGSLTGEIALLGLSAVPVVIGGIVAGGRLYARVSEARFRLLVYGLLMGSALAAIVTAIT